MQQIIPDLLKVVPRVNREEYLDVAVVRDVIGTAMETPGLKEKLQFPERTQELFTAAQYAYKLDSEINTELVGEVREYAGKLKNTDIREVLEVKLNSAGALLKGSPAVDLELLAPDGKTARLSDYKGKVIYVDYGQPGADLVFRNPRNSMSWRKNTGTIISFSWLFLPIQRKSPGFHLSKAKKPGYRNTIVQIQKI